MRVAGIGFRSGAGVASLRAALAAAGGGVQALATAEDKAPALRALAAELGLPVIAVPAELIAAQDTPTRSPRVMARRGAGSLAEAAALAAAGPGARIVARRVTAPDRMATAAIAETEESAP